MTTPTDTRADGEAEAIQAGCNAWYAARLRRRLDTELRQCAYPNCTCTQTPVAVAAGVASLSHQLAKAQSRERAMRAAWKEAEADVTSFRQELLETRAQLAEARAGWRNNQDFLRHLCDVVAQHERETPNHFLSTATRDRLIQKARDTISPPRESEPPAAMGTTDEV